MEPVQSSNPTISYNSKQPESNTAGVTSLTQSPLGQSGFESVSPDPAHPVNIHRSEIEPQSSVSDVNVFEMTPFSTQVSDTNAVSSSILNSATGVSLPRHVQVVRRRKTPQQEEREPSSLPMDQYQLTLRSHHRLLDTSHALYMCILFYLPYRYRRSIPTVSPYGAGLLEPHSSGRDYLVSPFHWESQDWQTFYDSCVREWTYLGGAAGILFR
jgi:hypothetical protein